MAERYEGINTLTLMKKTIAAGTSGLSDAQDIRDISKNGNFSLSYITAPSSGATCGSSFFILHGCPVFDGTYINLGTFGTAASAAGESGVVSVSIPVVPFLKLEGSAGTNGATSIQAFLHVR